MAKSLIMHLYSRQQLDRRSAREQIEALSSFAGGLFLPERCDVYEPLREAFDPRDLEAPVSWLLSPGGRFMFRRTRSPGIFGYISNDLRPIVKVTEEDGSESLVQAPPPTFCTVWTVWLNAKFGNRRHSDVGRQFLAEMFKISRSDFGMLTTTGDFDRKNLQVTIDERSRQTMYVGTDPAVGLPGLYWMNIFSSLYTSYFGEAIKKVPATILSVQDDGTTFFQFGDEAADVEGEGMAERQCEAIRILGESSFFDIAQPDRVLDTPMRRIMP